MHQSPEDVVRVFDEFIRGFASHDLILDAQSEAAKQNASLLLEYVVKKYGWVTISYLQEADQVLGAKLIRYAAPKVKTADELAQEEILRQNRDYLDSLKPQPDFSAKMREVQRKKNEEKAAKAQADAKGQLAVAISGYQCYRSNGGGIDYTATEMMQKELRSVRVRNDFIRTLAVVRQIIQELPDHPKTGDVAQVVESLNARSVKSHQPKDSFGYEVREVGKLGGLR
jgi:hypothetical protein